MGNDVLAVERRTMATMAARKGRTRVTCLGDCVCLSTVHTPVPFFFVPRREIRNVSLAEVLNFSFFLSFFPIFTFSRTHPFFEKVGKKSYDAF